MSCPWPWMPRPLTTSRAGVATYCRGLLHGLATVAGDTQIPLYAKDEAPPDLPLGGITCAGGPWRAKSVAARRCARRAARR